jgi:O-methyltransferase
MDSVGTPEFTFTPEELVSAVYRAVLNRNPDSRGFETHVAALKRGHSLEELLKGAIYSKEFKENASSALRDGTFYAPTAPKIPDGALYTPRFSPWQGYAEFPRYFKLAQDKTVVGQHSCYVLYRLALQAFHVRGDFWECGVYKGGTAALFAELLAEGPAKEKRLHLFDTFAGMPDVRPDLDKHKRGDFADTSLSDVKATVGHPALVHYHPGFMPDTFAGLEASQIAFARVDVDIYQSVRDCCEFIFPRLSAGGFMIFDDYGLPSCPGARRAVDEYFEGTSISPLVLSTGQALVFKSNRDHGSQTSRAVPA